MRTYQLSNFQCRLRHIARAEWLAHELPSWSHWHRGKGRERTTPCRQYHSTGAISQTPALGSWNIESFRSEAFSPAIPCRLPRDDERLPEAAKIWFVNNGDAMLNSSESSNRCDASELRTDFWRQYKDTLVPLELTTSGGDGRGERVFRRSMAPLKLMLDFLTLPSSRRAELHAQNPSVYLAQCPLPSLPTPLQDAVPTPDLVKHAGRGDIYDSSLWLGRPPTYTPLHRDPNPNLFIQLAGRKVVRLLPPEVGNAIFERVQETCRVGGSNKSIRGEEMMMGLEHDLLETGVWGASGSPEDGTIHEIHRAVQGFGQEAELGLGEALFIPKGWWHSVKGIGEGITASVNWWFR
jgi:hypothetical protein